MRGIILSLLIDDIDPLSSYVSRTFWLESKSIEDINIIDSDLVHIWQSMRAEKVQGNQLPLIDVFDSL